MTVRKPDIEVAQKEEEIESGAEKPKFFLQEAPSIFDGLPVQEVNQYMYALKQELTYSGGTKMQVYDEKGRVKLCIETDYYDPTVYDFGPKFIVYAPRRAAGFSRLVFAFSIGGEICRKAHDFRKRIIKIKTNRSRKAYAVLQAGNLLNVLVNPFKPSFRFHFVRRFALSDSYLVYYSGKGIHAFKVEDLRAVGDAIKPVLVEKTRCMDFELIGVWLITLNYCGDEGHIDSFNVIDLSENSGLDSIKFEEPLIRSQVRVTLFDYRFICFAIVDEDGLFYRKVCFEVDAKKWIEVREVRTKKNVSLFAFTCIGDRSLDETLVIPSLDRPATTLKKHTCLFEQLKKDQMYDVNTYYFDKDIT